MNQDPRIQKFAQILVGHSAHIVPGDRVLIEATTAAEPLIRALYAEILDRGGHPHLQLKFPHQDAIFFEHAQDAQLDFVPTFTKLAYDEFESRIRIHSETDTQALSQVRGSDRLLPPASCRHQAYGCLPGFPEW